jgi:hypothetical protein
MRNRADAMGHVGKGGPHPFLRGRSNQGQFSSGAYLDRGSVPVQGSQALDLPPTGAPFEPKPDRRR